MKSPFIKILKGVPDNSCAMRWLGVILLMALPVTSQAGELKVCNQIGGWVSFERQNGEHSGNMAWSQCGNAQTGTDDWVWINIAPPIPTWFNWKSFKIETRKCNNLALWVKGSWDWQIRAEVWCDNSQLRDIILHTAPEMEF